MFITDQIAYSTVRIECIFSGNIIGTGTGFFMNLCIDGDTHIPVIVTNRHVVKGAISGKFCLTKRNEKNLPDVGNFKFFEIASFAEQWFYHPSVDLAVMPIAPLLNQAQSEGDEFYIAPLTPELIPTEAELKDMPSMQEIVMVGYPNGIWDYINNQPIFRKGITATHPELDYNGKPEFLIDAACFNGSSGSPVFIIDIGKITSRSQGTTIGSSRVKLLGILYAGPQHVASGEIKTIEIGEKKDIALTAIPNNLGNVISSKALLDFESQLRDLAARGKKPNRNDLCPCGSNFKYKYCHGKLI
jgi:hypothetical protein